LKFAVLFLEVPSGVLGLRQLAGEAGDLTDPRAQLLLGEGEQLHVVGELVAGLAEGGLQRGLRLAQPFQICPRLLQGCVVLRQGGGGRLQLAAGLRQ
jgi:hypothetical protein